jgi:hypothetical protein
MKTNHFFRNLSLIIAFIVLSAISGFALNPAPTTVQQLQKVLDESIIYPSQAVKNCCTGSAVIIFTVSDDGKINIRKLYADSPNVEKMVRDQVATLNLKDLKVPSYQYYKIKISFKLVG